MAVTVTRMHGPGKQKMGRDRGYLRKVLKTGRGRETPAMTEREMARQRERKGQGESSPRQELGGRRVQARRESWAYWFQAAVKGEGTGYQPVGRGQMQPGRLAELVRCLSQQGACPLSGPGSQLLLTSYNAPDDAHAILAMLAPSPSGEFFLILPPWNSGSFYPT